MSGPPPPPPPPPPPLIFTTSADNINQLNESKYISTSLSNLSFSNKQKLVKEMFDRRQPPPAVLSNDEMGEPKELQPLKKKKPRQYKDPSSESSLTEQLQPLRVSDEKLSTPSDSNTYLHVKQAVIPAAEVVVKPPPVVPQNQPTTDPSPHPYHQKMADHLIHNRTQLVPVQTHMYSECQNQRLMHHTISSFEQCLHHTLDTLLVSQLNSSNKHHRPCSTVTPCCPRAPTPTPVAHVQYEYTKRPAPPPIQKLNQLVQLVKLNTERQSKTFLLNMDAIDQKNRCIQDSKLATLIDLLDSVHPK